MEKKFGFPNSVMKVDFFFAILVTVLNENLEQAKISYIQTGDLTYAVKHFKHTRDNTITDGKQS